MTRLQIALLLIGIALIGWLQLIYKFRRTNKKEKYAIDYLNKFRKYVESQGNDNETYGWMIYESVKMQRQLGILGIMSSYKPPGADYIYNRYQVLLNMLPELHSIFNRGLLTISSLASDYIQILRDMLVRHLGVLNEEKNDIRSELANPIKAFRAGIQLILLLPAYIVNWFGLATNDFLSRLSRSLIFKFISGIVAIVGFISAVIGIVVGWGEFMGILKSILIH